jgi:hypothetical protein
MSSGSPKNPLTIGKYQCFGSTFVSTQLRIQLFISMRIRIQGVKLMRIDAAPNPDTGQNLKYVLGQKQPTKGSKDLFKGMKQCRFIC